MRSNIYGPIATQFSGCEPIRLSYLKLTFSDIELFLMNDISADNNSISFSKVNGFTLKI